jgi:hypothetical protein
VDILTPFLQRSAADPAATDMDWELLSRQAQKSLLLSHVAHKLKGYDFGATEQDHFLARMRAAEVLVAKQHQVVAWELQQISNAVEHLGVPVIVLKGGAYIAQKLLAGQGRLLSDIDILVPRSSIESVENALKKAGYFGKKISAYDEKYYRKWMHEIPPLVHFNRHTTLDVHHTILPLTVKLKPDPKKLLQDAVPLEGFHEVYRLSDSDLLLHSCAHLFHDGELEHGLRDLVDMDALIHEFVAVNPNYWEELCQRAWELGLQRPLYYGMRYCRRLLNTPIPEAAWQEMQRAAPGRSREKLMDFLFERAFRPSHPSCDDRFSDMARWVLYVRSHYLRMPLYLLIPHLFRKAFIVPYEKNRAQ